MAGKSSDKGLNQIGKSDVPTYDFLSCTIPELFFPELCNCGGCTEQEWVEGRFCERPNKDYPQCIMFDPFRDWHTHILKREIYLETRKLETKFRVYSLSVWQKLISEVKVAGDKSQRNIEELITQCRVHLPLPPQISCIADLSHYFNETIVSWFNWEPVQCLAQCLSQEVICIWEQYSSSFQQYCSQRKLKEYSGILFCESSKHVFILEIDESINQMMVSEIPDLCACLCHAFDCQAVNLHIVQDLAIEQVNNLALSFCYCFEDYADKFTKFSFAQVTALEKFRVVRLKDRNGAFNHDIQVYMDMYVEGFECQTDQICKLEGEVSEMHMKCTELEDENCKLAEKLREAIAQLNSTVKTTEEKLRKNEEKLFITEAKLSITEGELIEKDIQDSYKETKLSEFKHENAALKDEGIKLNGENLELKSIIDVHRKTSFMKTQELYIKDKQFKLLLEENTRLEMEVNKHKKRADTLEEDIESLKKEIEKLYNTLVEEREYNRRETASKKEVNHMKKELDDKLKTQQNEIAELQKSVKETTRFPVISESRQVSPENLTSSSATRLMRDCDIRLSKWSDFATDFDVPVDKREEFRQRRLSTQESLEECLDYWIRNVPGNKSWESLCSIVDKHDKVTANEMRRKLGISGKPLADKQLKYDEDSDGVSFKKTMGRDESPVESIRKCEIRDTPVSWDDIVGLENAKESLREIVVLPTLKPELFMRLTTPAKGLLLFGPPGNGKTLLAKAVAHESKSRFFDVSGATLLSKWVGESKKLVKALFDVARECQPTVIFIDEVDSLLNRDEKNVMAEFLTQFDGMTTSESDRILVMGATNRPEDIDEAALRRFTKKIYIPLPDSKARDLALQKLLKDCKHEISDANLLDITSETENYSFSDLTALAQEAAKGPMRELTTDVLLTMTSDLIRPIQYKDFVSSLSQIRPCIKDETIKKLEQWNQKYGSQISKSTSITLEKQESNSDVGDYTSFVTFL